MDYQSFKKRINEYIVFPSTEQRERLLESKDTIHFAICLSNQNISRMGQKMQEFCDSIFVIEERGGVFPKDFFVTAEKTGGYLQVVFHSLDSFMSDDDFNPEYMRYKNK